MTGQRDYLLRVLVEDLDAYDDFVKTVLRSVSNISSMETSFALHEVKALTQTFEMRPAKQK
jgi:Lrp/AsnC family leucine-responsive transcriptional regulator